MGTQEWLLLALVLIVPLIIAVVVTLWTLEQAIKRNKKNQTGRKVRRVAEPVAAIDPAVEPGSGVDSIAASPPSETRSDTPPSQP